MNCHATLARFLAYTASVKGRAYQLSLHDRKNTDLHPLPTHTVGFTFHHHHCIPTYHPAGPIISQISLSYTRKKRFLRQNDAIVALYPHHGHCRRNLVS